MTKTMGIGCFLFLRRFTIIGWSLFLFILADSAVAQTLPAGTSIQVRLRQTISSYGSEAKSPVRALVIAPVEVDGEILIPLGAELTGQVYDVRRVGLGFSRESAWIHLVFDSLQLPGGETIPIAGKITEVDNSRETIDDKDRIHGIRATASLSSTLSGLAVSATAFDPMLLAFGFSASQSIFRIPESEIVLPVGTEMHFEITAPVVFSTMYPPAVSEKIPSSDELDRLPLIIRDLPFRTVTASDNQPSDLTNLAFIGTEEAVRAAFDASGWLETENLDVRSKYGTMRSVIENQGYQEAPMSTLLLNGREPLITYSKTLNTFFKRHHLRVFSLDATFDSQPLWTASSTQDTGVAFATLQKSFIHLIDENIDNERQKVVNDLILTGCVDAVEMQDRPWVPLDAMNATGDRLITDGRIAVIQLNDCVQPERSDTSVLSNDDAGTRPSAPLRATRNTFLTLRNDLLRGNIIYQGYYGIKLGLGALRGRKSNSDQPRTVDFGGHQWQIVEGPEKLQQVDQSIEDSELQFPTFQPLGNEPSNYETFLEFSISGGYSRFENERFLNQPLDLTIPIEGQGEVITRLDGVTKMKDGWNIAVNTTFNAHSHFSHEIGFALNQTEVKIDITSPLIQTQTLRPAADIRQFHYALLLHALPNGARFRPYAAIGGGMQMLRLKEASQSSNTVLKFAFKEANILYSAFRFGGDPPMEGGGIFQPTLNYGGGFKFHLTHRLVFRADWRETLSAQPDWWSKSHETFRDAELQYGSKIEPLPVIKYGRLRQQRASIGFGITF